MGGFGSGRTGGGPTVEGCNSLVLDINRITRPTREHMRKRGMSEIAPGQVVHSSLSWQWTRYGEDEPWAEVEIRLELRSRSGTAWLRYDVDHFSRPTGPQEYPVSLETTPCRFGGLRWWWICPATGRRAAKLYLPNGGIRFLSRGPGAYRLPYASQRQGRTGRMHARSRQLYRKLGAEYYGPLDSCLPPKPKRMRWRTYEAICDKLNAEAHELNLELIRALRGWGS